MSSPSQRRQVGSVVSTPRRTSRRSAQPTPSRNDVDPAAAQLLSEAQGGRSQGTPRNRQPVRSSSPIRYGSSPAPMSSMDVSSPLGQVHNADVDMSDGGQTPRPSNNYMASSPMRYDESSPHPTDNTNGPSSDHTGLFVSSRSRGPRRPTVRGDVRSDRTPGSHNNRRTLLLNSNGGVLSDVPSHSDAGTFSNNDPTTSQANDIGGQHTDFIWGTSVSLRDSQESFKEFLYNYAPKYRMWAEGLSEEETRADENSNTKIYLQMLKEMIELGESSLVLDLKDLKAWPKTQKLWHSIKAYPIEVVPILDSILKDCLVAIVEEQMSSQRMISQSSNGTRNNGFDSDPPVPMSDISSATPRPVTAEGNDKITEIEDNDRIKVRCSGLDQTTNLRELNPKDMEQLVAIKGLVIRTTPIVPDMQNAFFKCQICGHAVEVEIDRGQIKEPTQCPRPICKSPNSMQIVHNRCKFMDRQVIKIQETPDSVPAGQTPHSVSVCAYDDLVDFCKAGDRVEITGVFRATPVRVNPNQRTLKAIHKTYVDAVHIQKTDKKRMGIDASTVDDEETYGSSGDATRKITPEEEEQIKATAERPDIYDLLSRSLAPSIFEMDDVKKGILLQLFGGTNKSFEKGGSPKYRGDINILLCGDPSSAKSQILKYVHKIAPRGVYTSGKGSSAVGLTAYVTRDPETRQLVLESGALVLSDGGVCCIDEFDKMSDATRSVLHEVMEQQTVSIAKAGIITTLNARTSILASANPIGSKYNPDIPVPQNIDLPPTLLSRFDLVYLILDRVDKTNDQRLARHLLSMYLEDKPENASASEILPIEFLTSYISYARARIQPRISDEASKALVEAYVEMRKLGEDIRSSERRITATTRQLESMIRLSEAHAKMRLSSIVTRDDVLEAVRLIKSALKQAATDSRTGKIDMSLLTEGTSASERKRKADLKNSVLALLDDLTRSGTAARYSEVLKRLNEGASLPVDAPEFAEACRLLEVEGAVQLIGEGARRSIRRVNVV